ncbi:MAG: hypothetical protein ACPGRX_06905 [Bdellovibrionales bacterium]
MSAFGQKAERLKAIWNSDRVRDLIECDVAQRSDLQAQIDRRKVQLDRVQGWYLLSTFSFPLMLPAVVFCKRLLQRSENDLRVYQGGASPYRVLKRLTRRNLDSLVDARVQDAPQVGDKLKGLEKSFQTLEIMHAALADLYNSTQHFLRLSNSGALHVFDGDDARFDEETRVSHTIRADSPRNFKNDINGFFEQLGSAERSDALEHEAFTEDDWQGWCAIFNGASDPNDLLSRAKQALSVVEDKMLAVESKAFEIRLDIAKQAELPNHFYDFAETLRPGV